MNVKKYLGLFNIKNYILETIENFSVDTTSLITDEEKKHAANKLINIVSKLTAVISLQPLPFADILIITPIQVSLVLKIAKIYNRQFDTKIANEVLSTVIKGVLSRTIAKSLVKYIPIIGAPTYFTISFFTTHYIGSAAIRVFENKDEIEFEQLKENFEKEFNKNSPIHVFINTILNNKENLKEPVLKKSITEPKIISQEGQNTTIYLPSEN
jgi:GTP-binding protein Era